MSKRTATVAANTLLLIAASTAAQAQNTNDQGGPTALEEVVVTARQREERLQDVPISVTAFSARDIESAGIERAADFIALTPNVSLVEAQNAGTSFMTIRGISQVRNGESPVATVVDGVLQVSPNQFTQELFDIERIEVLKGPQGALYGRNAIGGAINIVTRAPAEQFEGFAALGGGNGALRKAQAGASGPLSDRVRYRLAGSWLERDGYIDNTFRREKVDSLEDKSARLRVVADLSDRTKIDLRASISRTEGGALNYVFQPLFGVNDADDASIPITANNASINERDMDQLAAKLDFELTPGVLTITAAWDRLEEYIHGDQFPYSPAISATSPFGPNFGDGTQTQFLDVDALSQEVRFTSRCDRRVRWIVGAYHLATERYLSSSTGFDLGQGIQRIRRTPAPTSTVNPTATFLADDNDNTAWAMFGQANIDLTQQWELGVALRYDEDEREQTNRATLQFDPNAGQVRDAKFDELQPKVTLTWKPADIVTVFGSYGEGFRSGGFNQSGVGNAASLVGLDGVSDLFRPESSRTYEIGFKSRLANGAVRLDASIFDTDLENQHYFSFIGQLGAQVLTNIDEVRLRGFEIEAQALLARGLTLLGGYGYTDSEIRKHSLIPTDRGNDAPYVPRYSSNVGFDYRHDLGKTLELTLRGSYERKGSQYWDPSNTTARSAVGLLDARVGVRAADETWSVTAWGHNLSDELYNAEYVLGGFATVAMPRSYGVDFRLKFGR